MRTVVFAYHNMGIVGLEALKSAGFHIVTIFSHKDDPGEYCWFASVSEWASRNHIEIVFPVDVNKPQWVRKVSNLAPDVIFSFYYRHILNQDILNIPSSGAYNLHGSLLPAYRGRAPVNWVLVNDEKQTGITLHHMVAKPDAGDIVGQKVVNIDFSDTARTLYDKLCQEAKALLEEVLPLIRGGKALRIPQDLSKGSYFGGRRPANGRIDWRWPALRIYNLIRAVTEPYPGAFAFLPDGEKILIWWALPEKDDVHDHLPGQIEIENDHIYIRTGEGRVRLIDIETTGSRMKDDQILHSFRSKEGLVLT